MKDASAGFKRQVQAQILELRTHLRAMSASTRAIARLASELHGHMEELSTKANGLAVTLETFIDHSAER